MKEKMIYTSPVFEAVNLRSEGVLCASPDVSVTVVSDPWSGNTEVDW